MTTVPTVTLNNGVEIPQLGFGTFQIDPADATEAVAQALDVGYRHIDTAEMYGNEAEVGAAVRASGLPRDEVFVTSKLDNPFHARDDALAAFDRTIEALGLDHVDLFLIHWPQPTQDRYVEAWKALEEIYASGRARAIGVSNFETEHLDRLAAECDVTPAVNQIEVHPYLVQHQLRAVGTERGIATEAWSPIAQGEVLDDPVLTPSPTTTAAPRPGHAALAPPARRHRLPQDLEPGAHGGELRGLRLHPRRRRDGPHHRPRPRRAAGPAPERPGLRPGRRRRSAGLRRSAPAARGGAREALAAAATPRRPPRGPRPAAATGPQAIQAATAPTPAWTATTAQRTGASRASSRAWRAPRAAGERRRAPSSTTRPRAMPKATPMAKAAAARRSGRRGRR